MSVDVHVSPSPPLKKGVFIGLQAQRKSMKGGFKDRAFAIILLNMHTHYTTQLNTPIGPVTLTTDTQAIVGIELNKKAANPQSHALLDTCIDELEQYFTNAHHRFNLKLTLAGTPLQQKIWHALQNIPVGETRSYGELAAQVGTHPRVIGNACHANPVPIIVPCHRIVSKTGWGGFSGHTDGQPLVMKKWLLNHEQAHG